MSKRGRPQGGNRSPELRQYWRNKQAAHRQHIKRSEAWKRRAQIHLTKRGDQNGLVQA